MWNFVFFLFAAAGALLVAHFWLSHRNAAPTVAVKRQPQRRPAARAAAAPAPAPIETIAWDHDPVDATGGIETSRDRLRDRYIAARFPGLLKGAADLDDIDEVIRIARLCFEDERDDHAHELLTLAIDRAPANEELRLAQLEFAFLKRSRTRFIKLAAGFRQALPASRNWSEIARLGRAIAPEVALFAGPPGAQPRYHFDKHYGPWPDLPNWIHTSWDLTGEVLAADFRKAVLREDETPAAAPRIQTRTAIGA